MVRRQCIVQSRTLEAGERDWMGEKRILEVGAVLLLN